MSENLDLSGLPDGLFTTPAAGADGDPAATPAPETVSGTGDPNAPKPTNPAPETLPPLEEGTYETNEYGVPVPKPVALPVSDTAENPHLPAASETATVDTPSPVTPEKTDRDMLTELYEQGKRIEQYLVSIEANIQPALDAIANSPIGAMFGLKK